MATLYRPTDAMHFLRPTLRCQWRQPSLLTATRASAFSTSRSPQATHNSTSTNPIPPPRRSVTVTNDTGQVPWSSLSPAEKAARTTQQSFNLIVVAAGVVATLSVGYILFADIISPSSKTAHFNRATTLIRSHPQVQSALGPGSEIAAYGENSWSRNARNRFISHTAETDRWGTEHLRFRFFVEGPKGQGTVQVHLTRRPSQSTYEYETLAVDVKGGKRIYVEKKDGEGSGKTGPKMFGVKWW